MGTYKFYESHLLYKGTLYKVEGWDADYEGVYWESTSVISGLPYYEQPLVIAGFPNQTAAEEIKEILTNTSTFRDTVKAFAEKKIFVCVDTVTVYNCELEKRDYERDMERVHKVALICRLLDIDDHRENYINNRKILAVCPEFILLHSPERYDAIFLDDIEDITLSLKDCYPLITFKDGTKTLVNVTHSSHRRYIPIRYC